MSKVVGCWRMAALFAGGLAALGLSSCSGCSEQAALTFVPKDAVAVVIVPSLSGSIGQLEKLSKKFQQGMIGGALIDRQAAQIKAELGFDPRKPSSMRKVGIDPKQGLVVAFTDSEQASVVIGVTDRATLDKYLRKQLQKVARGGAVFKDKSVGGTKLTVVTVGGREDVAAWTFVGDGHLVVGGSKHGGASGFVAGLTKLGKKTIEHNPTFTAARKQLGETHVMLYVDGGSVGRMAKKRFARGLETASDWMKKYIRERQQTTDAALGYFAGAALGLQLEGQRLALKGYYAAPSSARAKVLRKILSGEGDAAPLAKYIGADALVVGRCALNLRKAMEHALEILPSSRKRRIYRKLERAERENNLSFDKDVLGQLAGRFAVALYPPKGAALSTPPRGVGEAVRATPVALLAQINKGERVKQLLGRLERFLVMQGLDIRPRSEGDSKRYTLQNDGRPVASWTVHKQLLVLATGDRLTRTLALIDKGGENVLSQVKSKRAKAGLKQEQGMVLHADLAKITDVARGLDLGMDVKVMLTPVFSALGKFKDITATVEPADSGLAGELEIRFN